MAFSSRLATRPRSPRPSNVCSTTIPCARHSAGAAPKSSAANTSSTCSNLNSHPSSPPAVWIPFLRRSILVFLPPSVALQPSTGKPRNSLDNSEYDVRERSRQNAHPKSSSILFPISRPRRPRRQSPCLGARPRPTWTSNHRPHRRSRPRNTQRLRHEIPALHLGWGVGRRWRRIRLSLHPGALSRADLQPGCDTILREVPQAIRPGPFLRSLRSARTGGQLLLQTPGHYLRDRTHGHVQAN